MANASSLARRCVLPAVCLISLSGPGWAQTSSNQPPSIQVVAEATVVTKPDQVEIDIGVTTQAQRSRDAATRNAQVLKAVLEALEDAAGPDASLRTISYTLHPDYRFPKDGGKPAITGYTASNTVRVTLTDLDRVGDVIDAATNAGANQIHRVQFGLRDEQAVQSQALRDAVVKARSQAEALATALDLRIVRILSVTESERSVRPYEVMRLGAEAATSSTPIQPGTIEISATVTLDVEIAPR